MPNLSLFLQNGWSLSGAGCVLVDGGGVGGGESDCRNISDKNLGEAATAAKPLQSCLTLCNPMDCGLPDFSVHGVSLGKNTGVGCHALLQRIFPIQGSNTGLLHCRWILYHLSHQGHSLNKTPSRKTLFFSSTLSISETGCIGVFPHHTFLHFSRHQLGVLQV